MEKTTIELINSLPEPFRSRALDNAKKQKADMAKREKTPQAALSNAFVFDKTPEGFEYWLDLCCRLADGDKLEENPRSAKIAVWAFISSLIIGAILWGLAIFGIMALLSSCSPEPQKWILSTTSEIYSIDQKREIAIIHTPCADPDPKCYGRLERVPLREIDFPYVGKKLKLN